MFCADEGMNVSLRITVEITLNTYAHVLPAMQEQAAATMGAILHR
jgi:hypothetical protein